MSVSKSLGETLTALRRESGLTQPGVAALLAELGCAVQPAAISKWEKGQTMPNAAQFLEVPDADQIAGLLQEISD